jgi:hypothetical protein
MAGFNTTSTPLKDDLLFKLLQDHVRQELRTALTPVIDKIVNDCIDKAIDSMGVTLHTYYDHTGLGQVVKIIMEKK